MSEWQEVNTSTDETWDGKGSIEGLYTSKKTGVGPNSSNMYILKVKDKVTGVWGSTVLDSKFETIPLNVLVKIESAGMAESKGGKSYKDYRVFFKGAPYQEVAPALDDVPVDAREPQGEDNFDLDL